MHVDPGAVNSLEYLKLNHQSGIPGFNKSEMSELSAYLKAHIQLPVYGFNSSRYDLPIIFPYLIKVIDRSEIDRKSVSLLKKGLKYFSVKIGDLHFKDLLNFTCPMSLEKYLSTWTRSEIKLVYPYEKFSSIEEIRNCKVFPPIEEFKTTLKPTVDEKVYLSCKSEFERRMNLPLNHAEKWTSFEDYLKFYNLSDVKPASLALITQFDTYLDNFGSYPNRYLGLPSFAKDAMFALYDEKCPNIFTFPRNSDATEIFRKEIVGGLTNVYKRHVTLDENEEAAPKAKFSARGKKWQRIEFYDINSMYPTTYQEMFPCGLGYEWNTAPGGSLTKKLMTNKQISMESLEWLDYISQVIGSRKRSRKLFGKFFFLEILIKNKFLDKSIIGQ